ncbi:Zinc ribbon domain protein [Planctomycetes bacterium Poly30]|uniref:Zinc ribbon domain protein n=1 Tax=Saltatorellus ferox TaxID=2528018 RepID=A0A518EUX4_9BACT|nr:Zinc ribbon domain protein [Planctomycetes bacterium Poly30]
MPTYDYRCNACGHVFEEFQMMSEPELKKCPECKKNKLERLIGGGAGFLFKGSGYYLTDYRSKSYSEAKKADSGSGGSGSGDSGGDTKPKEKPKEKEKKAKPD